MITRFNASSQPRDTKLHAHILGNHGFSLLHAAINFAQPELVRSLLKLGAEWAATSAMGNALVYAKNRAHHAKYKLDNDVLHNETQAGGGVVLNQEIQLARDTKREKLKNIAMKLQAAAKAIETHALKYPIIEEAKQGKLLDSLHCENFGTTLK